MQFLLILPFLPSHLSSTIRPAPPQPSPSELMLASHPFWWHHEINLRENHLYAQKPKKMLPPEKEGCCDCWLRRYTSWSSCLVFTQYFLAHRVLWQTKFIYSDPYNRLVWRERKVPAHPFYGWGDWSSRKPSTTKREMWGMWAARLAQSVEHSTLDLGTTTFEPHVGSRLLKIFKKQNKTKARKKERWGMGRGAQSSIPSASFPPVWTVRGLELLPGSVPHHQAARGSLTCVPHGLQRGPVRQLPQGLPTSTGVNQIFFLVNGHFHSHYSFTIKQSSINAFPKVRKHISKIQLKCPGDRSCPYFQWNHNFPACCHSL